MCTPIRNTPPDRFAPRPATRLRPVLGFRRTAAPRFSSNVIRPELAPVNNSNVCSILTKGGKPSWGFAIEPWEPGDDGRVVLTVSNVNAILDDSWDFKINGITVCNYDGDGATTTTFSANLPPGLVLDLSAECVGEQNDNLFSVTVTVDGVTVIDTQIGGEGTVGEVQDLGTFTT